MTEDKSHTRFIFINSATLDKKTSILSKLYQLISRIKYKILRFYLLYFVVCPSVCRLYHTPVASKLSNLGS